MAGIYIHIPFCKQACTYCNFHFSTNLERKPQLIHCLIAEIEQQIHFENDPEISTIYFGGGTPSLLSVLELKEILQAIKNNYKVDADAEITIEVNPDDISTGRLAEWLHLGINRLSVGIQTFSSEELKWMNRAHSALDSIRCLRQINEAGFKNFSADLIYGSPFLTDEMLVENVEIMASYYVPHLSCYALTVEEKTLLHHQVKKNTIEINDAHQSNQFLWLMNHLPDFGYQQYEISNFAKAGFESKHNSSYWKGKPYYGFGPSAHSYDGKKTRRWNIANNALYIQFQHNHTAFYEEELLTDEQQLNEQIMISLRTSNGIDLDQVQKQFGKEKADLIVKNAGKYIRTDKIIFSNAVLRLTNEGRLFADGIAADLFI